MYLDKCGDRLHTSQEKPNSCLAGGIGEQTAGQRILKFCCFQKFFSFASDVRSHVIRGVLNLSGKLGASINH